MSSAKRKPRTPSPLEDESPDKACHDAFAGRRVSVSEFDTHGLADYDAVASPGASSTSSEPSYVRQPGFDQHAHEVTVASTSGCGVIPKSRKNSLTKRCKKKKSCPEESGEIITIAAIPQMSSTKPKIRKEPLPMKLRSLPQSFWVQPNRASCLPPSGALLPPLLLGKDLHDVTEVRPVTPPEDQDLRPCHEAGNKYSISTPSPTLSSHSLLNLHYSPSSSSLPNTAIITSHSSSSLAALASSSQSPSQHTAVVLRGTTNSPPCESYSGYSSVHPSSPASPTLHTTAPHSPSSPGFSSQAVPSSCHSTCQSPRSSCPPTTAKCTPERTLYPSYQERRGERIIKVGNTDLLFSLFDKVEQGDRTRLQLLKRAKIRKGTTPPSLSQKEEDPCLVGAVTEGILPYLDSTPHSSGTSTPLGVRHQVVEMVTLKEGNRTLSLPSLNTEPNYNHILSELVMRL